jgi:PIN domain nuclease of toxin-antitoxin system
MTSLLLDTNALIWWLLDDPAMGHRTLADIANPSNRVYASHISLFEIAIKERSDRPPLGMDILEAETKLAVDQIDLLAFEPWAAQHFVELPKLDWQDPFDAAMVAMAQAKRLALVTGDQNLLGLKPGGLKLIDARK